MQAPGTLQSKQEAKKKVYLGKRINLAVILERAADGEWLILPFYLPLSKVLSTFTEHKLKCVPGVQRHVSLKYSAERQE